MERERRRRRARLSLVVLALFSLGGAGWLVAQSSVLDLETVRVKGGPHTPHEVVREVAALDIGEPLLFVNRGAVARRVEALPWIASADVSWDLPATLTIRVTERTPVAWVRVGADPGAGVALVDGDARVLDHRVTPPGGLPELVLKLDVPAPGRALEGAGEGLAVAATVPGGLRGRILAVDEATTGWVLRMDAADVVRFGPVRDSEDLRSKWSALEAVVERLGDRHVYLIDVRAPSVPAVRAEKAAPTTTTGPEGAPVSSTTPTTSAG